MALLSLGSKAPDFTLPDAKGGSFSLSKARGRPVVLAFYCEDGTEGCATENAEFSALVPEFKKAGAEVVAISPQDVESHRKFAAAHGFRQPLLADPQLEAIRAYGLWDKKKMWGNEFMGVLRVTYLVDAEGNIAGVYKATRIKGHAQKVLEATEALARE